MALMIDRRQLAEAIDKLKFFSDGERAALLATVYSVPAVDAVEVVRCKYCKKGHPELAPNGGAWCAVWNHVFCDDGFCSYGERRE